jgi:hypothetical protein
MPNSMHMGGHWDPNDNEQGDGSHFRTLQAFMTAPINLAFYPSLNQPLEMSFFHIARMVDNNAVGGVPLEYMCADCGDVQLQRDIDPNSDPNVDIWGEWSKLVPSQNIYDKKTIAFSVFGVNNCEFTPTDAGTTPPNPHGVHETMCYPQGTWSRCGHTGLGAPGGAGDCAGPTFNDPGGKGARWVQTKFDLSPHKGQRIRMRWIGQTWEFNENAESYFQLGAGWNSTLNDDGWWLDDIRIQGAVMEQFTGKADTRPDPGGACPASPCDESQGPDHGTNVILKVTDLGLNVLDGVATFPIAGQKIRISASDSILTGGCAGGVAEFQFSKNGALVQDWGAKTFYLDAPEGMATYTARMRCSSDFACTSAVAATVTVQPSTGDGSDAYFANPPNANLGFRYFRGACTAGVVGAPCNAGVCAGGGTPGAACTSNAGCGAGLCTAVNADCGAGGVCGGTLGPDSTPANNADNINRVSIVGNAGQNLMDLYRGSTTGQTVSISAQPNPPTGATVALGNTAHHSHVPFFANANPGKQFRFDYTNAADGIPAAGSAFIYMSVGHAPGGAAVNGLSCPNLGVCNNTGWCNTGGPAIAGTPCTSNAQCGTGTCTNMAGVSKPFCTTDTGMGDVGGCGRHSVCVAGPTPGKLCLNVAPGTVTNTVDCGVGGTCSAFSATASTAGQICYKAEAFAVQQPFNTGCLSVGNAKHLLDQATPGNVCP